MPGEREAVKKDGGWWVPVGLVLLTLVLAWLSPSEKTLGDKIKLVFLHGALTWVGMLLYTIAGVALWVARIFTGKLFHPQNPIGESNIAAIKVFFAAIFLVMLLAGLDVVRRMRAGGRR